MDYELKLEHYQGPLDKLLELVEEKKLEVTLVSLATVTGDFLSYLKKLEVEALNHGLIADFLLIASRLLLIKSKVLIPNLELEDEEKEDIRNLELRLKIYQEFKKAKEYIKEGWNESPQMASREFLMGVGPVFYPPKTLTVEKIHDALLKVTGELEKILKPTQLIKTEIINLKAKIEEVLARLTEKPQVFDKLRIHKTKNELVVLFLAILHLIKEELVQVEQQDHFEDIILVKRV